MWWTPRIAGRAERLPALTVSITSYRCGCTSRHFQSQNLWHFHKNICSCVKNECCCPSTVNISNVNFTSKIFRPPDTIFTNMGQQMSGTYSLNGKSIRHESEGWGSSPPQVETFPVSNYFDTFTRTSVRGSKMNAVVRAVNISNVNFTS